MITLKLKNTMNPKGIHVAILIALQVTVSNIKAQQNFLDPTFGNVGKTMVHVNAGEYVKDIKLQSDGKIILFGSTSSDNGTTQRFCVSRLNSNGSIDNTFGTAGITETFLGTNIDKGKRVVILPDGKIIACGTSDANGYEEFAAVKYNTDGTLDNSFGNNGIVLTSASGESDCKSIVVQPDGKFILAGAGNASSMAGNFALVRYNANGSLDNSFGVNGRVLTAISNDYFDGINDVTIQADGKIIAVGRYLTPATPPTFKTSMAIIRYNTDGSIDNSFGVNGVVTPTLSHYSYPSSVKVQPDGKIVVFGAADSLTTIIRLNPNGTFDNNFGINGVSSNKLIVSTGFASFYLPGEIELLANGKILTVGTELSSTLNNANSILALFNSDGTLSTNFGVNGIIQTGCIRNVNDSYVPLEMQTDNKIVTGGSTGNFPSICKMYIERYSSSSAVQSVHEQASEEGRVLMYPNPATNKLYLSSVPSFSKVEVMNSQGSMVRNELLNEQGCIDIEDLPAGMYFLKVKDQATLNKFIKE